MRTLTRYFQFSGKQETILDVYIIYLTHHSIPSMKEKYYALGTSFQLDPFDNENLISHLSQFDQFFT
jgi:hypothetical protein